jgi:hypothetical protein
MRHVIIMLTLLGTMAGASNQAAGAQSRLQREAGHLRFVSVADYAFGIAGDHWGVHARVTVSLHANNMVERIGVMTTATGAFLVGVTAADLCDTTSVQARDESHHRIALHGPQKPCLVVLESSPRLTVLRGKPLPSH